MKFYSVKKNFLGIGSEYSSFNNSKIVILPVPYEVTTSYGKGTAKGPEAILKASHYVEFFDEELKREVCFEKGICTLFPLKFRNRKEKKVIDYIYRNICRLIKKKKFVVTLGGEHTISIASVRAHYDLYPDVSILHFDAHSDLRDEYEGTKYSHACFAARILEFTEDITQIGIRAQCREEYELIRRKNLRTFYSYEIRSGFYGDDWMDKAINTLKQNVYITFDIDYFDPSLVRSTGTPEPDGFFWGETMYLLKKLGNTKKILGFDLVELSPRKQDPFSDFLSAKLVYKMLNYFIK